MAKTKTNLRKQVLRVVSTITNPETSSEERYNALTRVPETLPYVWMRTTGHRSWNQIAKRLETDILST